MTDIDLRTVTKALVTGILMWAEAFGYIVENCADGGLLRLSNDDSRSPITSVNIHIWSLRIKQLPLIPASFLLQSSRVARFGLMLELYRLAKS